MNTIEKLVILGALALIASLLFFASFIFFADECGQEKSFPKQDDLFIDYDCSGFKLKSTSRTIYCFGTCDTKNYRPTLDCAQDEDCLLACYPSEDGACYAMNKREKQYILNKGFEEASGLHKCLHYEPVNIEPFSMCGELYPFCMDTHGGLKCSVNMSFENGWHASSCNFNKLGQLRCGINP